MTNEEGIHAPLHPGFQDCRPVLVDEPKSCCTVLMEACKRSYVYHAIITWLSIVMIFTTPIADPDVLSIELVAVFVLMFVVIMLGVHAQTTNARLPGARV
ncbi:Protein CBG26028 [Caenorhabditis briggsae]|uniref:Protein CBG26028 n=1 Tax=Caenorhabditis briggsae TaxID=6238 RepID=B6ILH2_CAEBR|nr:Protein CBG26028 [Caenorhabditis briggsae]CAS00752.1 Protein CBG26028 [Caenorhabditis briggsae]